MSRGKRGNMRYEVGEWKFGCRVKSTKTYLPCRKGNIKRPIVLINLQPLLFWNRGTEAGGTDAYF